MVYLPPPWPIGRPAAGAGGKASAEERRAEQPATRARAHPGDGLAVIRRSRRPPPPSDLRRGGFDAQPPCRKKQNRKKQTPRGGLYGDVRVSRRPPPGGEGVTCCLRPRGRWCGPLAAPLAAVLPCPGFALAVAWWPPGRLRGAGGLVASRGSDTLGRKHGQVEGDCSGARRIQRRHGLHDRVRRQARTKPDGRARWRR